MAPLPLAASSNIYSNESYFGSVGKMDCRDCQHLHPQFLWCEELRKEIRRPWEEACKDFVPRLWELDHATKLGELKRR